MDKIPYEIKRKLKNKKGYVGIDEKNNIFVHINYQSLTPDVKEIIKNELKTHSIKFFKIDQ